MEVILLEKVSNLGALGEKVSVRAGFGRNYLIPTGKAVSATKANLEKFEARREELEKQSLERLTAAKQRATQIDVLTLSIEANASDEGKLYGSIGTHEIQKALHDVGVAVEKREIVLSNGAFHEVGDFEIEVQVHPDVSATLRLNIKAMK